jgi:lactoylglutathione lyase
MKGLAFVKDPDGYLIEILPQGKMITKPVDCDGVAVDGGSGYVDNSKK